MSFRLSVAFQEATHCCPGNEIIQGRGLLQSCLGAGALHALVSFEHVFDVPLEHEQVWRSLAIDLQRATIVPLDRSFNFLTVKQNDHHHGVSVDLFLVVENFRIGFVGRWNSLLNLNGSVLLRGTDLSAIV